MRGEEGEGEGGRHVNDREGKGSLQFWSVFLSLQVSSS